MHTIYDNKAAAMKAAKAYQKENGGVIFDDSAEDLFDDWGHFMGTYGEIAVGTGEGSEPFGDSWKSFYYEL